MDWLYLAVTGISALAAVLAWSAKLRWSKEFAEAKNAAIQAKDAALQAKTAEIQALKAEILSFRELSPQKIREYFVSTKEQLEGYIDDLKQKLGQVRDEAEKERDKLQKEVEAAVAERQNVLSELELTKAEQARMMEAMRAEQMAVFAKACHELNSPVHNLLQLMTALQFVPHGTSPEKVHQWIRDEVHRLKRVTNNYLLGATRRHSDIRYDFKPTAVGDLVAECVSCYNTVAKTRGIDIAISFDVMDLPTLVLDAERIDQVISNVIDNAVKYSFDHTQIDVDGRQSDDAVTISVSNVGLGIPAPAITKLFDGYEIVAEDRSRFRPGTGLGLMVAKLIVDRHRGRITVASEPIAPIAQAAVGQRPYLTTFTITLPKKAPAG